MITRVRGRYLGRNASSAYKDLVWAVGTAKDTTVGIEEQTTQTLEALARITSITDHICTGLPDEHGQ